MRGVIQVRCQRPCRRPAQARDHAFEVAVEGDRVAALAHQPRQIVGDVEIPEMKYRALRRRPPFQRRDMRERVEPAPVGGQQRRQRQFVHDAGKAGRIGERALGIGQRIVGRQKFVEAHARQIRQSANALGCTAPRPGPGPSARPSRRGSRETTRRAGRCRRRPKAPDGRCGRPNVSPQTCGNGENLRPYLSRRG